MGAHPSLPDLQGFGRREMKIGREELANCIIYQVGALKGFLEAEGMTLNHIKPHGSLYGMAARMEEMAHAVCDAADVFKVPLMGMINTFHEKVYTARGHSFIAEFYADLDYRDDGSLIITREHEAKDPVKAAALCVRAISRRQGKEYRRQGCRRPRRCDLRPFRYAKCGCHRAGRAGSRKALSRRRLTSEEDIDMAQLLSPLPGTFYRSPPQTSLSTRRRATWSPLAMSSVSSR